VSANVSVRRGRKYDAGNRSGNSGGRRRRNCCRRRQPSSAATKRCRRRPYPAPTPRHCSPSRVTNSRYRSSHMLRVSRGERQSSGADLTGKCARRDSVIAILI
jgi:hypothetical protein